MGWCTFRRILATATVALLPDTAHCAEPIFTYLQAAEVAPFQGYLFSHEAVGNVITVDEERLLKALAQKDLAFAEMKADLEKKAKEKDATIRRLTGEIEVKEYARVKERDAARAEIARMHRRALLYGAVGALAGAGVASALIVVAN